VVLQEQVVHQVLQEQLKLQVQVHQALQVVLQVHQVQVVLLKLQVQVQHQELVVLQELQVHQVLQVQLQLQETSGSSGTSGAAQASGGSTISGTSGTSGSSGTTGATSTAGQSTASGTSGTSGSNGTSGAARTSGTSSASGTSGTAGTNGTSGLSFNGTSGISGGTFVNQPDYLVRTTAATTIQSVSFLYVDTANLFLGINTTGPTDNLDVNGTVSFSNRYVWWDTSYFSFTAGDINTTGTTITAKFLPGHSTLFNQNPAVASVQGTILHNELSDSALTIGQLVYYRGGTGQWALADASAVGTTDFLLGIVLNTVGAATNEIAVLIDGIYTSTFVTNVTTVGDVLYVSETAGNVTAAVPTTTASIVRGVGQVIKNNGAYYTVNFRPDTTYFTNG